MPKTKHWSYNAGTRGENWVRAYEHGPKGWIYLEWLEDGKRKRESLSTRDRAVAVAKAEKLSAEFAKGVPQVRTAPAKPPALDELITLYLKEVSPGKGVSMQGGDRRSARVWRQFFAQQNEPERQADRLPGTLDRLDWERFCEARSKGRIEGWEPVGARQVGYDLEFLLSVLSWATGVVRKGVPLLDRNPWNRDWRQAQKIRVPKNPTPHRPGMTDEIRDQLIDASPHWQFELALILERETRRRNATIRQLVWSDVDLEQGTISWRGEIDKCGRANVTPLTEKAIAALKRIPSPRGIGAVPVFPSATNELEPTPRDTFQTWLRRAKQRSGVHAPGLGFHGEKRAGVRDPEFRNLPAAIQEAIAGTNHETLRRIYDDVPLEDMRDAMAKMGRSGR